MLQGLIFAVQKGFNELGNLLINGAGPITSSKVLFLAARKGLDKVIAVLLKNINWASKDGANLLYMAADKGNLKVLEILLRKRGIAINSANTNGETALFVASKNGNENVAKMLLETEDIDVNLGNNEGVSPLVVQLRMGILRLQTSY